MWIEIIVRMVRGNPHGTSQPARAVWIEILKKKKLIQMPESQPARAVWIEMFYLINCYLWYQVSQPARAVWIEIICPARTLMLPASHSLRGLCGLKYVYRFGIGKNCPVTACEGCVD